MPHRREGTPRPTAPIARLAATDHLPDPQCRLAVRRIPMHGAMRQQHSHGFEELVVILDGRGQHQVGRETYDIETGDVFVLLGNMSHCYPRTKNLSLINLLYDSAQLRLPRADLGTLPGYHALFEIEPRLRQSGHFKNRLKLAPTELGRLASLIAELETELKQQPPGYRFMATMHFMRIIGFLARAYSQVPADESRSVTQLSELLSYIEQHHTEPLTIEAMAQVVHMSPSALFRTFRQVMGRPPVDYLIRLRIGKAAQLLRRPSLRISEVSEAAGFNDSNYFTRQFRQIMGVSPRDYRQQHR